MQAFSEPPIIETLTPSRRLTSANYFIIFAAISSVAPFFVLYLQSLGFTGAQIGAITSLGPFLGIVATPFWTGLADASNRHRRILMGAIAVAVAVNLVLPFLRTYSLIFAAQGLLALLTSHMLSLQDSATLHMLGGNKNRYGRIRLWGTIGWGVGAPVVGAILGKFGLVRMFWIYAFLMGIFFFLVRKLEFEQSSETDSYFKNVTRLLRDRQWLLFLVTVFLCGVGLAAHLNYMPLLLQQGNLNTGLFGLALSLSAMVGITLTVSTIFEAPVMLQAHTILVRFGSQGSIFFAMLIIGLRNLLYASAGTPNQILAIQVLHGLTYPLLWLAGVSYAAERAPRGLSATAQGMFASVLMGLGTASGNFFCGWLIDQVGVYGMFRVVGLIVLGSLGSLFLLSKRLK